MVCIFVDLLWHGRAHWNDIKKTFSLSLSLVCSLVLIERQWGSLRNAEISFIRLCIVQICAILFCTFYEQTCVYKKYIKRPRCPSHTATLLNCVSSKIIFKNVLFLTWNLFFLLKIWFFKVLLFKGTLSPQSTWCSSQELKAAERKIKNDKGLILHALKMLYQ